MTDVAPEPILDPERPIVDPHHHLWDRRQAMAALSGPVHPFLQTMQRSARYLLDEFLLDLNAGHNIEATVFVECSSFHRQDGPPELKPVGETEFVNGVAAMSASGLYGSTRVCAGIVGHADLTRGAAVRPVLEAHLAAGGGRFRGVRQSASWDADPGVLGPLVRSPEGRYRSPEFRAGFAELAALGLSFDAWLLEPQLPDLIDLARAFPETTIVLDHVGTPLGLSAYEGRRAERFDLWRGNIRTLAACPNVVVKLGGLAMPFCNFDRVMAGEEPASAQLARQWAPYLETCIQAFGPERCMFESNFPVDLYACSYATLWNALKRVAEPYSEAEKDQLFRGTATRVYRL